MSVRETMLRSGLPFEVNEIFACVANAMKSATKAATFTLPDPIPEVAKMTAFPRSDPIPEAATFLRADPIPPPSPIPEVTDMTKLTLVEPTTEATEIAKVQKLCFEIHRRFDPATLRLLVSADNMRSIASRTLADTLRSVVHTEVAALLEKLTTDTTSPIAHEITQWIDLTMGDSDCAIVIQVIDLVYDKATNDRGSARVCGLLCRQLIDTISAKILRHGDENYKMQTIDGGYFFRDRLLRRYFTEVESVCLKMNSATPSSKKSSTCTALKTSSQRVTDLILCSDAAAEIPSGDEEDALSAAHERGCAAVRFIGELAVAGIFSNTKALGYLNKLVPENTALSDPQIRFVCAFLLTAGPCLHRADHNARTRMDRYISFVKAVDPLSCGARTAAMIEVCRCHQR